MIGSEEGLWMRTQLPPKGDQLLANWGQGDDAALTELTPLVYEDLRRLAHRHMEGQRPDHTLQTTALVDSLAPED